MKLAKIRPYDVSKFFVSLTKDGARKDGEAGGYSFESIRKAKTILSSILSTAVRWEILEANPCLKAELPKMDEPEEQTKAYTVDQARRLLKYAEDEYRDSQKRHVTTSGNVIRISEFTNMDISSLQTLVLVHVAILGGLRRGEMVGLDWDCIDYEKNLVHVRQSAARTGRETFVKTPKSKCSVRSVAFPQPVMDLLRELQEQQERYREIMGDKWNGTGECVFTKMDGARMEIGTPYDKFHRLVRRYNGPGRKFCVK